LGGYDQVTPETETGRLIASVAAAYKIKPSLLAAILLTESSGGENNKTSWAGAKGPMQLTEVAAKEIGVDYNDPRLINDLPFALDSGAKYLTKRVKQINTPNNPTAYYTTYNRGNFSSPLGPESQVAWARSYAEAKRRKFK
jgi:soluble lytic murein transglycosylase-like protein